MTTSDETPAFDPWNPTGAPQPPPVPLPPHFANYDPGRYARRRREFEEEEAQYDLATYQRRGPDPYSVRSSDLDDDVPTPYPTRRQARQGQQAPAKRRRSRPSAHAPAAHGPFVDGSSARDLSAPSPLRPAGLLFLAGVAATLVSAVITIRATGADNTGGLIWKGGFVLGIVLFVRSFQSYRAAARTGARVPLVAWGGVALGAAVVLSFGGVAAASSIAASEATPGADEPGIDDVGACWHEGEDDQFINVSCRSDRADYRASREVTDVKACDEIYLDGRKGYFLCLTPIAAP